MRSPGNLKLGPLDVKEGDILRYPKPGWFLAPVFGASVEAMLDSMDKDAAMLLADTFVDQAAFNAIPIPAQTITGLLTGNRNPFSMLEKKIPITPNAQRNLMPDAMGSTRTTPLAEAAGNLGMNPFKMDFAIDRFTGGLASSTLRMLSGGKKGGHENADLPIIGRFFDKSGSGTEGSQRFYKDLSKFTQVDATFRHYEKLGDAAGIQSLLEKESEVLRLKPALEGIGTAVAELNKIIQLTAADESMEKCSKREYIKEYQKTIDDLYLQYNSIRKP